MPESPSTSLSELVAQLASVLEMSGQRIATAESCTGGGVATALTTIAGSSRWFEYGFVTYSNDAKTELLGVPVELLTVDGAVSRACVEAMARGALARSGADFSVAVSGIAGPGGGSAEKPVGTVWFACASKGGGISSCEWRFTGDRDAVRSQAVVQALRELLALVEK